MAIDIKIATGGESRSENPCPLGRAWVSEIFVYRSIKKVDAWRGLVTIVYRSLEKSKIFNRTDAAEELTMSKTCDDNRKPTAHDQLVEEDPHKRATGIFGQKQNHFLMQSAVSEEAKRGKDQ
jgi:hypothetical protein